MYMHYMYVPFFIFAVDGSSFMKLSEEDFKRFGFNRESINILGLIQKGLRRFFGDGIVLPSKSDLNVILGIESSKANLPPEVFKKVLDAEYAANTTGEGLVYGQLVVLGYSEYRITGNRFQPIGGSNEKFRLKRRKIPSGYKPSRVYVSNGDRDRDNLNFGLSGDQSKVPDPQYTISISGAPVSGTHLGRYLKASAYIV